MMRKNGHMTSMKKCIISTENGNIDKRKLGGRFDRFDFSEP